MSKKIIFVEEDVEKVKMTRKSLFREEDDEEDNEEENEQLNNSLISVHEVH